MKPSVECVDRQQSLDLFLKYNCHQPSGPAAAVLCPFGSFWTTRPVHQNPLVHRSPFLKETSFCQETVRCLKCVPLVSSKTKLFTTRSIVRRFVPKFLSVASCSSQDKHQGSASSRSCDVDAEEEYSFGLKDQTYIEQRRKARLISESEISHWLEQETGWDRVRMMYAMGPDGIFVREDTRNMNTIFYRTVVLGAIINMFKASMAQNSKRKEKHPSQAQTFMKGLLIEHAAAKGFWMEAMKNTLRFSCFTALLIYVPQTIAAYRNQSSVWEYSVCSSLAFGLMGLQHGVQKFAVMSFGGAVAGVLGGYVACRALAYYGLSQEQKHVDNIKQYLQEQKLRTQEQRIQN